MKTFIGALCFIVTIVAISSNAAVMLISPRLWFRLPHWMRLTGSLTERKFSSGFGGLQVRILGAIFLAMMAWFAHGWFVRS
jgi:hypothetical protein